MNVARASLEELLIDYQDYPYLLDALIKRLQQDFAKTGGIKEQMTAARLAHRRQNPPK